MSRLVVAVSQRVDLVPERDERRDALDQRLCAWLASAGCQPVPVPNSLVAPAAKRSNAGKGLQSWLSALKPGAVVLSSGFAEAGPEGQRRQVEL